MNWIWLIVGGGVGTLCRYGLNEWASGRFGPAWPFGTIGANGIGCLIIGLLLGFFESRFGTFAEAPLHWRLLLITGFLGALTTFSSYELEAFLFMRDGLWQKALVYLLGSIAIGLLLLWMGVQLGRLGAPKLS